MGPLPGIRSGAGFPAESVAIPGVTPTASVPHPSFTQPSTAMMTAAEIDHSDDNQPRASSSIGATAAAAPAVAAPTGPVTEKAPMSGGGKGISLLSPGSIALSIAPIGTKSFIGGGSGGIGHSDAAAAATTAAAAAAVMGVAASSQDSNAVPAAGYDAGYDGTSLTATQVRGAPRHQEDMLDAGLSGTAQGGRGAGGMTMGTMDPEELVEAITSRVTAVSYLS